MHGDPIFTDVMSTTLGRALLGCQWGVYVSSPDDTDVCMERATAVIYVHDPLGVVDGGDRALKLCARHQMSVIKETTPSKET